VDELPELVPATATQGWSRQGRRHLRGEGPLDGPERGGADPAFYASGLLIALTGVKVATAARLSGGNR
jgi:hypothetical protein